MNELISVVIPVFKVEKYLTRCLKSVINQTYQNLEIIIVDDGSPDNCPQICDEYKKKDKRIKVIHKINEGLSAARNDGIKIASGNYITFIDSDDFISKFFIEELYSNIKKNDCDISICSQKLINELQNVSDIKEKHDAIVYNHNEAIKLMLYQKKINNSAWGKLYKFYLFDNIEYPAGKIYEDIATTYKLFLKANKICLSSCHYYYYTLRSNSISKKFNEKSFDILENIKTQEYDLKKYKIFDKALKSRKLNANFFIIRQIDKKKYINKYTEIINEIKKDRKDVLFDKNVRLKTKLGILVSYISFGLISGIYNKTAKLNINKKLD